MGPVPSDLARYSTVGFSHGVHVGPEYIITRIDPLKIMFE
jgi:hypothetical protein